MTLDKSLPFLDHGSKNLMCTQNKMRIFLGYFFNESRKKIEKSELLLTSIYQWLGPFRGSLSEHYDPGHIQRSI